MSLETWKDLVQAAHAAGWDSDEHVSVFPGVDPDELIWKDESARIACYAVPGANEGYYVHVEIDRAFKNAESRLMVLGKFWSFDRAIEFAGWCTRAVYGKWEIIPDDACYQQEPGFTYQEIAAWGAK